MFSKKEDDDKKGESAPKPPMPSFKSSGGLFGSSNQSGGLFAKKDDEKKEEPVAPKPPMPSFTSSNGLFGSSRQTSGLFSKNEKEEPVAPKPPVPTFTSSNGLFNAKKEEKKEEPAPKPPMPSFKSSSGLFGSSSQSGGLFSKDDKKDEPAPKPPMPSFGSSGLVGSSQKGGLLSKNEKKEPVAPKPPMPSFTSSSKLFDKKDSQPTPLSPNPTHTDIAPPSLSPLKAQPEARTQSCDDDPTQASVLAATKENKNAESISIANDLYSAPLRLLLTAIDTSIQHIPSTTHIMPDFDYLDAAFNSLLDHVQQQQRAFDAVAYSVQALHQLVSELEEKKRALSDISLERVERELRESGATQSREYVLLARVDGALAQLTHKTAQLVRSVNALKDLKEEENSLRSWRLRGVMGRCSSYDDVIARLVERSLWARV